MDKGRAKEIVSSPIMVNVTYNGMPIYIESINDNNETANIHYLNQSNNIMRVSLTNLVEH